MRTLLRQAVLAALSTASMLSGAVSAHAADAKNASFRSFGTIGVFATLIAPTVMAMIVNARMQRMERHRRRWQAKPPFSSGRPQKNDINDLIEIVDNRQSAEMVR